MLKIFGKNNNQLFRRNQKATYSMPQSLPFSEPVLKCACGFDYMAIITNANKLYFLFQAKFYAAENVPLLVDVATSENTVTMVTKDNQILVWDFDEQKIANKNINYTKIKLNIDNGDIIKKVQMGSNDIFLLSQVGKVYHFKRNQWYQTKSYSNIQSVELSHKIIDVSSGPKSNLFLSYEGLVFQSTKQYPLHLAPVSTKNKFIKIATNFYNAGITKKGTVMIWGNSIHGNYNQPTQFSKLTKKFLDVKLDKQNGYALADDGEVWVWGVNSHGQLGLSDYQTRIKPFPLITLQKLTTIQLFCGHSYACCIYKPSQKAEDNSIKVIDRKVSQFLVSKEQVKLAKKRSDPIYVESNQYQIKSKENSNSYSPFNKNKQSTNKSGMKKNQDPKKPLSPISHKKQACKAQQNKSRQKYTNNLYPRKSSWLISERENESDSHELQNRNIQLQLNELRQQNQRLKAKVSEQSDIINDITGKIRLLQQAIDEYERNLTSRDHILQDYQSKQHQYINHIDELQRTIDEIVRLKEKNQQIMVVYEDMKSNFEKQRIYYTDKIRDYEIKLHTQEDKYSDQIENLKKKLQFKQHFNKDKENSRPRFESHSPIPKRSDAPYFKVDTLGEKKTNTSMDMMIDQIQTNKSLITKSANKLIAMLDISQ